MKKIVLYRCGICGRSSSDKAKIQKCERKGRKNKFKKGEAVWFLSTGMRVRARITSIQFEKGTHKPSYRVMADHGGAGNWRAEIFPLAQDQLHRFRG